MATIIGIHKYIILLILYVNTHQIEEGFYPDFLKMSFMNPLSFQSDKRSTK